MMIDLTREVPVTLGIESGGRDDCYAAGYMEGFHLEVSTRHLTKDCWDRVENLIAYKQGWADAKGDLDLGT